MIGRKDAIRRAADLLETEMELIGITGVEDRWNNKNVIIIKVAGRCVWHNRDFASCRNQNMDVNWWQNRNCYGK